MLRAARCRHARPLPRLLEEFGVGAVVEDVAAQALDATALADLGEPRRCKRARKTPTAAAEVAEPLQRPQLGTDPGQGTQAAAAKAAEPLEMSQTQQLQPAVRQE